MYWFWMVFVWGLMFSLLFALNEGSKTMNGEHNVTYHLRAEKVCLNEERKRELSPECRFFLYNHPHRYWGE